jgi:hypothetical protein
VDQVQNKPKIIFRNKKLEIVMAERESAYSPSQNALLHPDKNIKNS